MLSCKLQLQYYFKFIINSDKDNVPNSHFSLEHLHTWTLLLTCTLANLRTCRLL